MQHKHYAHPVPVAVDSVHIEKPVCSNRCLGTPLRSREHPCFPKPESQPLVFAFCDLSVPFMPPARNSRLGWDGLPLACLLSHGESTTGSASPRPRRTYGRG